jgi:4-oxalocrotonate tautomerase
MYPGDIMPVVTISMAAGRTKEQKKILVEEITHTLSRTLQVPPGMVTILIHELERENIGKSGYLLCDSPP